MRTVRELLASKGTEVWTVSADSSVYDALKMMAEKNIGALVVTEGDQLAGIFSERDYARKIVLHGKFSKDTPVRDIMTDEVFSVSPDRTITECMAAMTEGRFRHLPVTENGRLVGIVSIGDVVKVMLSEKDFVIQQLENFIGGGRA